MPGTSVASHSTWARASTTSVNSRIPIRRGHRRRNTPTACAWRLRWSARVSGTIRWSGGITRWRRNRRRPCSTTCRYSDGNGGARMANRKFPWRMCSFAALLVLLPLMGSAAGDARMQKIATLMQRYQVDVPGASLLVVQDGRPVVRGAFGMADLEKGIKATPQTDYRLASVTKQFTAAAILLLRQDGKLSLQDSVRKWLPELPQTDQAITIDDMLRHASGLIDYEDLIPADTKGQVSDMDVLKLLSKQSRLYFPPGTSYRYSNSGYVLLGLIIERAAGESLPRFLKTRIFDPLGMTHTLLYENGRG